MKREANVKAQLRARLDFWRGLAFLVFFLDSTLLFRITAEQRHASLAEAAVFILSLPAVLLFLYMAKRVTEQFDKV